MKPKLRFRATLISAVLACSQLCLGEEAPVDAVKLWHAFLDVYAEESYRPIKAEELDQRARKFLLASLREEQAEVMSKDQTTLPVLVKKIAELENKHPFDLTEQAIQGIVPLVDYYGSYETTAELNAILDTTESTGNKGIFALRLVVDKEGNLRCYPDPDGPTAKAGLPSGAVLTEVNGVTVKDKSLSAVREIFSRKETAAITYTLVDGKSKSIAVTSSLEAFPAVQVYTAKEGVRLRIRHFSEGSAAAIKSEMSKHSELDHLTLDLRGNDGGLLQEALITCSYFLPVGAVISHDIIDGKKVRKRDDNDVSINAKSITVQMDGSTASGAELLITCLKYHRKDQVKLCGSTSYGKHFRTVRTQILDAGMLTVTDGIILGPDGNTWPVTGITIDE
jgi:carboxyl-terminal processing protease